MTTPYGTAPGAAGDGDLSVTSGADFRRPYSTAPEWAGVSAPPGIPRQPGGAPGTGVQPGRRWRRRHTLGCFGSLVGVVLLVVVVQLLVTPWAVHIGNSFTPMMHWSGIAQGRTAAGSSYAVQLTIDANTLNEHACSGRGCDDLHGSMVVCTAAGRFTLGNVSGTVGGWWSTDGQQMTVSFSGRRGTSTANLLGVLHGTWRGPVYQASDGGYLDRNFNADGSMRSAFTSADPKDAASLAFQPGDFDTACDQVRRG